MHIGYINLGAVDAISNQEVETRFFAIGLPLFPLQSYVMSNDEKICEIPSHFKSILYGYLRIYMAIITCLAIAQYFIFEDISTPIPMIVCTLIWCVTVMGGNLSKKDKLMCEAMGMTCKLYLHPRHMSEEMASEYLKKMESTWEFHQSMWNVGDWREVSAKDFGEMSGSTYVTLLVLSLLEDQLEPSSESQERVDNYYEVVLQNYTA